MVKDSVYYGGKPMTLQGGQVNGVMFQQLLDRVQALEGFVGTPGDNFPFDSSDFASIVAILEYINSAIEDLYRILGTMEVTDQFTTVGGRLDALEAEVFPDSGSSDPVG